MKGRSFASQHRGLFRSLPLVGVLVTQMILATPASAAVTITEFPVPTQFGLGPITAGTDGNIWFAESGDDTLGRITPGGAVTEFPLTEPVPRAPGNHVGPDGAVWFTETGSGAIGRIDPSGTFTEFPVTPLTGPLGIATGPDGNLGSRTSSRMGSNG